jgi:TP901 family phage tail tape measure protein
VQIGVDITDFEKQMNQVNQRFNKLGDQVQDAGAQIGAAFGGVSIAIAGGLGVAVKKAADFEQGLSNIKAVSGATGKEMEQLKQLALDMGASTKYSATEAAQGIEELVKAGVSMTDITNGGLKGALSLATAGGLELADAAEIASTALNAFRKDGLSVSKAADILAGAANASATSVQELKFGLQQVAGVSASVGMSFEDTTTALAVLAQNGKKGSDAGTSLKTMLMRLQPSAKEAKKVFEELNLVTSDGASVFFDAKGKLKSLSDISGILKNSMAGLSDAQKLQRMETIFGSDAIIAANILFNEGAEGVAKMKKAMSKVTAEQVAAEKMNNLNGAIEQLKGSFETFMISIGETLVPALKSAAKYLGEIVDWFNKLSPTTKKVITYTAALIAVLTGLVAIVAFAAVGMGFLAAAEWAVILPLLGIIAAVVAVIAIFVGLGIWLTKLYKQNETFRNAVDSTWSTIKSVIMAAVDIIVPIVKSIWDTMLTGLIGAWNIIKPALLVVWDLIYSVFTEIGTFIKQNLGTIKLVFGTVFKIITTIVNVALTVLWGIIKGILNGIVTTFRVVFSVIKLVVMTAIHTLKAVIKTGLDIIAGVIRTIVAVIKGDWSGAWQAIKDTVKNVLGNVGAFLKGLTGTFLDAGKGFINAIVDGFKGGITNLTDTVKGVMKKVREFLPFSPAKVGPLSDLDKLDFAGPISDSIIKGAPNVQANLNSMLQVPDVNPSVTADMSGGTTVIMQLDGRTLAKSTFAQMGGTFRLRGAVT